MSAPEIKIREHVYMSRLLKEAGYTVDPETVKTWLECKAQVWPNCSGVFFRIMQNWKQHLARLKASLVIDPDLIDNAAKDIAELAPIERKGKGNDNKRKEFGWKPLRFNIYLKPADREDWVKMAAALECKPNELATLFVEFVIQRINQRVSELDPEHIEKVRYHMRKASYGRHSYKKVDVVALMTDPETLKEEKK